MALNILLPDGRSFDCVFVQRDFTPESAQQIAAQIVEAVNRTPEANYIANLYEKLADDHLILRQERDRLRSDKQVLYDEAQELLNDKNRLFDELTALKAELLRGKEN